MTSPTGRPASLIVVDHDDDSRELYRQFLEDQGLHVIAATNAETALRVAEARRPDLIVTELALPEVDGNAVCRAVGRLFGRRVPVVTVTGFASPSHLASAKIAGAARVLTKPCPPDALLQCVETLLATWPVAQRQSAELHRLVRSLLRQPADARQPRAAPPDERMVRTDDGQLVGTVVASDSGLIVDADAGAASLTGYRTSELVGSSIWRLCPAEWRDEYRAVWWWSKVTGRLRGSINVMDVAGDLRAFQYEAVPENDLGTNLCAFMPEPSAVAVESY